MDFFCFHIVHIVDVLVLVLEVVVRGTDVFSVVVVVGGGVASIFSCSCYCYVGYVFSSEVIPFLCMRQKPSKWFVSLEM